MSFPFFKSHGLPTIVYSLSAQGVLTGKYTRCVELDSRARSPIANQTMWDLSKEKIEEQFQFYEAIDLGIAASGAPELEILLAPMSHDPIEFSNQFYL